MAKCFSPVVNDLDKMMIAPQPSGNKRSQILFIFNDKNFCQ